MRGMIGFEDIDEIRGMFGWAGVGERRPNELSRITDFFSPPTRFHSENALSLSHRCQSERPLTAGVQNLLNEGGQPQSVHV